MAMEVAWVELKVSFGIWTSRRTLTWIAAEYIRIPLADDGLIPIPTFQTTSSDNTTESLANDYLMLSDIFATGWDALNYAGFKAGDTVAIFGAVQWD